MLIDQYIKFTLFLFLTVCLFGCETYDPLFRHNPTQNIGAFKNDASMEPVIRRGDKITVSIWGHDELSVGSINSSFSANEATGRWLVVDETGEVNLPRVGRVNIASYNIKEANYLLESIYERNGIRDPVVNVRILSHYITLLGEVISPGRYQIDNETITLIELLGKAEGITKYAKADEIRVIRKNKQGIMEEVRVDLTNINSLAQNNIILKPDDVIYIPPSKVKRFDTTLEKITPIAGVLTSLAIIFSVFFQ
ncbi:MAG: polysaccharide export outer membrane protein [Cognaticolwellia sp.]|jgi:polysaccharide export outer membrane protein